MQYQKLFLKNHIKEFDYSQKIGKSIFEVTIKKAIKYAAKAWDLVQSEIIVNCWKKTDILSLNNEDIDIDNRDSLTSNIDDIDKI